MLRSGHPMIPVGVYPLGSLEGMGENLSVPLSIRLGLSVVSCWIFIL